MGGRGAKRNGTTSGAPKDGELTEEQKQAAEWYASGDGMWVNRYFRGTFDGGEPTSEEWRLINNLEAATKAQTVNEDVLYRAVDAEALFKGISETDYDNLKYATWRGAPENRFEKAAVERANAVMGKEVTEKGFMSTTKDFEIAKNMAYFTGSEKPVLLEIHGTKGLKGLDVGNATP